MIFYLVYSPTEQCAQNELESTLDVSGFEPAALKLTFRPGPGCSKHGLNTMETYAFWYLLTNG